MSKKKILEESTIRRFMKLASIGSLSENYFDKDRPVYREEFPAEEEEAPVEDEFGAEEEAPVDDFADEAPVESAAAAIPEEAVRDIISAIAAAVSEVTGTAVETVGGEEEFPGEEEAPIDDMGGEEPPAEFGGEEEAPARRYEEAPSKPSRPSRFEEAVQPDDEDTEVQEEATDEEEKGKEVQEESESANIGVNKADLRETDAEEEELEEADDDADDKTEVKEESKKPTKRKLTEEEIYALVTKRVGERIAQLGKKK
jgi:hypothetical protein